MGEGVAYLHQLFADFLGNGVHFGFVDQAEHRGGVHEVDHDLLVGRVFAHHHIARQQRADVRIEVERLHGIARRTGAEDAIGRAVDAELGLEGGRHVDVADDAETLRLQRFGGAGDGVVEGAAGLGGKHDGGHVKAPLGGVDQGRKWG